MARKKHHLVKPGSVIGQRYRVERAIARGGLSSVLLVRHMTLDSLHALKILEFTTPEVRERLLKEGRVQSKLKHPNIVAVTDTFEHEGSPALLMEYIEGPSLHNYLTDHRPSIEEVEHLLRGILSGLRYAHQQGLVHRDLKPANIMLLEVDGKYEPKLTDFGIVKVLESFQAPRSKTSTRTGIALGTPSFMSPEQMNNSKNVTASADIYSLGCILYEMVTGTRAFVGPHMFAIMTKVQEGMYEDSRSLAPEWPERFHRAIRLAMEPDQAARLQDCDAFARAVFEDEVPDASMAGVPPDKGSTSTRSFGWVFWAVGILLTMVIILVLTGGMGLLGVGAIYLSNSEPSTGSLVSKSNSEVGIPAAVDVEYITSARLPAVASSVFQYSAQEGKELLLVSFRIENQTQAPVEVRGAVTARIADKQLYQAHQRCERALGRGGASNRAIHMGEHRIVKFCFEIPKGSLEGAFHIDFGPAHPVSQAIFPFEPVITNRLSGG